MRLDDDQLRAQTLELEVQNLTDQLWKSDQERNEARAEVDRLKAHQAALASQLGQAVDRETASLRAQLAATRNLG